MRRLARSLAAAALVLASAALGLVAMEALLRYRILPVKPLTSAGFVDFREMARRAAEARGEPYDARKVSEIIAERRIAGARAFPTLSPSYFARGAGGSTIVLDGTPVLPVGINANAETYYCNESGRYARFETDRFGFRNPDRAWDEGPPDVLLVGDSFTFGACLDAGAPIADQVRAAGLRVLNLGQGANGPLTELASLREYAAIARPRVVLWMFFPNDLQDLQHESGNPILKRYLSAGYSQALAASAPKLAPAIDAEAERYFAAVAAAERAPTPPREPFWRFTELRTLAAFFHAHRERDGAAPDLGLFIEVLGRGKADAQSAGARLVFVYLPDCDAASYGQDRWKEELLKSVRANGLEVIDTEPDVAAAAQRGERPFFYCPGSHYAPEGARAIARAIVRGLERGR